MTRIFTDPRQVAAMLDDYGRKQLPFAMAQALNRTADAIAKAQNDDLARELDRPTPFTQRAFRVVSRATKGSISKGTARRLVAIIDAQPIQGRYLEPSETGGLQVARKVDVLMPRGIPLDAYGNIPAKALQRLKGNPNVFVGTVATKAGPVWGVWQRVGGGSVATKGKNKGRRHTGQPHHLKLLISGAPPKTVKHKLHAERVALDTAKRVLGVELAKSIAAALRSAR